MKKNYLYYTSLFSILLLEGVVYAQDKVQVVNPEKVGKETVFDLILLGGWVMIPIFLCSLVTVTLLMERLILLRKPKVVPKGFWDSIKGFLHDGPSGLDKAYEACVNNGSPIANILKVGVEKWKRGRTQQDIEKGIEDAASREVSKLARTLRGFKIVAGISPLLGLLGTVYGMIETFQTVASATESLGQDKAAKLASGIYQAMVTTAAGLTVAIPTLLIYYFLNRRIDVFSDDIEVVCDNFVDEYQDVTKK